MSEREKKIAEIRETLEKATPGPWKWVDVYKKNDFEKYNMGGFVNEEGKLICHFGNRIDYYPTEGEPPGYDDELLIANAPEWLRFLLTELDRIEREYTEERAAHNAHVTELCQLEQERNMYKSSSEVFYERLKKVDEERNGLFERLKDITSTLGGVTFTDGRQWGAYNALCDIVKDIEGEL